MAKDTAISYSYRVPKRHWDAMEKILAAQKEQDPKSKMTKSDIITKALDEYFSKDKVMERVPYYLETEEGQEFLANLVKKPGPFHNAVCEVQHEYRVKSKK